MNFDWSDLAFGSKKRLSLLKAIFITAPREISKERFIQLVKDYLPQGNIVLGISKENYIDGFEGQSQFKTLRLDSIKDVIEKVNKSASKNKIYTLDYAQRELNFILEKVKFSSIVLVNGSWFKSFHTRPEFYSIVLSKTPYKLVSPFTSEQEAKQYCDLIETPILPAKGLFSELQMLELAQKAATGSFDNSFQTGVALGQKVGDKYELLATAFNEVVPYQTYAMHFGASRETNFSPPHDLNHYDTIHAEVALLIKAQKHKIDLKGTTLFINLLPCPSCARMFVKTDIAEFVYSQDHSDGYGFKMLDSTGKKIRRIVR